MASLQCQLLCALIGVVVLAITQTAHAAFAIRDRDSPSKSEAAYDTATDVPSKVTTTSGVPNALDFLDEVEAFKNKRKERGIEAADIELFSQAQRWRIDRERLGIDRERLGIDRERAQREKNAGKLLLVEFDGENVASQLTAVMAIPLALLGAVLQCCESGKEEERARFVQRTVVVVTVGVYCLCAVSIATEAPSALLFTSAMFGAVIFGVSLTFRWHYTFPSSL